MEFSIVLGQLGVVECVGPVEGRDQPVGEVTIEAYRAVRIEQRRIELNAVSEIGFVVVLVLDDRFVAVSGRVKALEQTFDRISQRPDQAGLDRPGPRGLVEYEAGLHELRRRREARAARSIWA